MKNRFSLVLSALTLSAAMGAAQADVLTVNADGSVQQVESSQTEAPQSQQSKRQTNVANDAGFQTFSPRGKTRGIGSPTDAGTTTRNSDRHIQSYPYPYDNVTSKHKNDKIVVQPGTDVIVNGDNTKIVIKPGQNYYGGYYPPYYAGYPYGHTYNYGYGYGNGTNFGYPANYGYPYGYGYSYPGYNYGYNWPTYTYGPGTTTTTYNGNALGYGFGGYTRPSSGINVTIGGGRQSVQSTTTVTVAPGSSMTVSGPGYNLYGAPGMR